MTKFFFGNISLFRKLFFALHFVFTRWEIALKILTILQRFGCKIQKFLIYYLHRNFTIFQITFVNLSRKRILKLISGPLRTNLWVARQCSWRNGTIWYFAFFLNRFQLWAYATKEHWYHSVKYISLSKMIMLAARLASLQMSLFCIWNNDAPAVVV